MRTALPSEKPGFLSFLRPRTRLPEPTIRVLPTEPINPINPPLPEDIMRQMLRFGGMIKEKSLRAQIAREGGLHNACPQCGTTLEPVEVEGVPLLGCPHRTESTHRTGAMPKLSPQATPTTATSPVRDRATQAAAHVAKEQIDAFFKFRQSFFFGKSAQSAPPKVLAIEPPRLPFLATTAPPSEQIVPVREVTPVAFEIPVVMVSSALDDLGALAEGVPDDDTLEVPIAMRDKILERLAREAREKARQQEG